MKREEIKAIAVAMLVYALGMVLGVFLAWAII